MVRNTLDVITTNDIRFFVGYPVCAVLKDGTYYYGIVKEVKKGELVLQGFEGTQTISPHRREAAAQLSVLGFGGGFPFAGGMGNWLRMGLGLISFIAPLFRSGFFI